jgi:hypothetical protein
MIEEIAVVFSRRIRDADPDRTAAAYAVGCSIPRRL